MAQLWLWLWLWLSRFCLLGYLSLVLVAKPWDQTQARSSTLPLLAFWTDFTPAHSGRSRLGHLGPVSSQDPPGPCEPFQTGPPTALFSPAGEGPESPPCVVLLQPRPYDANLNHYLSELLLHAGPSLTLGRSLSPARMLYSLLASDT